MPFEYKMSFKWSNPVVFEKAKPYHDACWYGAFKI
jgi:hypothetical protein